MTTGRKPTPMPASKEVPINEALVLEDMSAATVMGKRSLEVAERFGDGVPYERERVVSTTVFFMGQAAEAALSVGKMLIQIKENEGFGEFTAIVENRLGMNIRTAQLMMSAAVKYLSPKLASKANSISLLGKSKLLDLMCESDDDLVQLAEGGTIAGLTLDDMHSMSMRELRAALTEARQTLEARAKLLDKANAKADRLKEKLAKPYVPTDEDVAKTAEENKLLSGIAEACSRAQGALQDLATIAADLESSGASRAVRAAAHTNIEYLAQRLANLILEHGIPVQFETEVVPAWVTSAKAKAGKTKQAD